jgi:trk system potassium uptake protein TrkH
MELDKNLAPLSYAVRPLVVARYFGPLCVLLALTGLIPLLFVLLVQYWDYAMRQALVCAGLAGLGMMLGKRQLRVEVQRNEALVIVVLTFLVAALAFALPMIGRDLSFADALFESVSGITTTGLTTIRDVEAQRPAVLFTAAWLQWTGGLGIMVLGFALLFGQGVNAMRLSGVLSEQSGMIGGTRAHGRIVLVTYLCLTLAGILVLRFTGLDWFDAATLGLAAISTGGYSTYNASIAGLSAGSQCIIVAMSVAGAFSMLLYYRAWRREWHKLFRDPELHALVLFAAVVAAALTLSLWHRGMSADVALQHGLITALSAQSTTGFSTLQPATLDTTSRLLLIFSMLAGGGVDSTAGGFKLFRLLILLCLIRRLIVRSRVLEHAVTPTRFLGRDWSDEALQSALLVVLLHLMVIALSWLAFLPYGYDPLNALFEAVSATGTVGLSTGITSPAMPLPLQAVLIADMLLGRLEIVAVLVFLAPRTWFGQRRGIELQADKQLIED